MRKEQTQIRMDAALKKRVRRYMLKFEQKTRATIGFSAAVRMLIEQALEQEGIK